MEEKKKRGRPPKIKEITPELLKKIENLAGAFFTHEEIALALDIGERTFREMMERNPEISAVYKKGKNNVKKQAVFTLRQAMQEGSETACIFLLKTQFGFREKDRPGENEKDSKQSEAPTKIVFSVIGKKNE